MPSFNVLASHTYPSAREDRVGLVDRAVVVKADNGSTHTVMLPDETFSEDRLKAAVARLLETDASLAGQTFNF